MDKNASNRKGRPKHPPCPACKKSLYKQMGKKPCSTEDPWAFCRNEACKLYGQDQTGGKASAALSVPKGKPLPPKLPALPHAKKGKPAPAVKTAATPGKDPFKEMSEALKARSVPKTEPEEIKRARARIKEALHVNGEYTKSVVGLTLALAAQELGSQDVANRLIDEFDLTKLGIEKHPQSAG